MNSTYFFLGRLSPSLACTDFRVDSLKIGEGFVFEVIYDGIVVWKAGVSDNFDTIRSQAMSMCVGAGVSLLV